MKDQDTHALAHDHGLTVPDGIEQYLPHLIATIGPDMVLPELDLFQAERALSLFSTAAGSEIFLPMLSATYSDAARAAQPYWPSLTRGEESAGGWSWVQIDPPERQLRIWIGEDGCVRIDAAIGETRGGVDLVHLDTVGALVREAIFISLLLHPAENDVAWSLAVRLNNASGRFGGVRWPLDDLSLLSRLRIPDTTQVYERTTAATTAQLRDTPWVATRDLLQDLLTMLGVADGPFTAPIQETADR